ncbi:hypothetical protein IU501_01635 [Nocardia otitidiscaviarum]|uniref:hypothetical protein n=1 Tax=Nocardia otitidiscaviarum TaxID=1823 RepID=UPI0011DD64D7|nr:hypothetical protein [Nocardia otitidiscaviarum]MBF6131707.1 hypothetical protein [Nocardia otitidiscaviarum]MBF6482839.1 hypothetical protein [Nocardia otitidiscaviarum]
MRRVCAALAMSAALLAPAGFAAANSIALDPAPSARESVPVASPSTGSAVDAGSANGLVNAVCGLIYILKIGSVDSSGGPKCGNLS